MSQTKHNSTDRAFLIVSAVAVATAIVAGFWVLGSPGQQRLLSLDSERVNDLSQITSLLAAEVENPNNATPAPPLPEQLPNSVMTRDDLRDPDTDAPYEYRRLSESTYELCATFATDSKAQDQNSRFINSRWTHPAGRHCFEVQKSAIDPKP